MNAQTFKSELSELFGAEIQFKIIFTSEEALKDQMVGKFRALLFL